MKTRAAVQLADRTLAIQEFEVPETVAPGEAILQVEACGLCGTDYESYVSGRNLGIRYPVVTGHEPVGRIVALGEESARTWGVREGDRVAVEPFVPCAVCSQCLSGRYQLCRNRFRYGFEPTSTAPGLWGGFAGYMLLRSNTVVHRIPEGLSPQDAALFNPIGGGFEWAYRDAGTQPGDSILIMGPGQRGLGSVIAAREAGAGVIIVTGRNPRKLAFAVELGATHTIDVTTEDTVERVRSYVGKEGVDRVVDVSAGSMQPIADGLRAVRRGGTVVLAGMKGMQEMPGFVPDRVLMKGLHIVGGIGTGSWSYKQAIRAVASGRYPVEKFHTHQLPLDELESGILLIGGEITGEEALHITVTPS